MLLSLWNDDDWRALTSQQHDVYAALLTTHDLSWCGVAPLLPQRLVGWSVDLNLRRVQVTLEQLAEARFVVVDEGSGEILVRSYVRHDDLLKQPNVTKAMAVAVGRIRSLELRAAVIAELGRALKDEPDLRGWRALAHGFPELFQEVQDSPSGNPSPMPSGNPS